MDTFFQTERANQMYQCLDCPHINYHRKFNKQKTISSQWGDRKWNTSALDFISRAHEIQQNNLFNKRSLETKNVPPPVWSRTGQSLSAIQRWLSVVVVIRVRRSAYLFIESISMLHHASAYPYSRLYTKLPPIPNHLGLVERGFNLCETE